MSGFRVDLSALTSASRGIDGAGQQRIDTSDGWSGGRVPQGVPRPTSKRVEAGGCFHAAAQAVDTYITTPDLGSGTAADAIREYDAGQAATTQAKADHAQAVQQAQAAVAGTPAPDIPFIDPGEAKRQAARQLLDRARKQLTDVGNTAADALDKACDKAPPSPAGCPNSAPVWRIFAGNALHGLENAGKALVTDAASFGNAVIHHPGELATAVGSTGLTVLSAAGEGGGLLMDATGIRVPAGGALNVVSAAGMAAGVGTTGASVAVRLDVSRWLQPRDRSQKSTPPHRGAPQFHPIDLD